MIKLELTRLDEFTEEYSDLILRKLEKNNCIGKEISIFDENIVMSKELLRCIIGNKLDEIFNIRELNSYFKVCKFINYVPISNKSIKEKLNKEMGYNELKEYRKKCIDESDINIINLEKKLFPNYYQNQKNYKDFIRRIKEKKESADYEISSIINYDKIDSKLRNRILNEIGQRTCPYCNRSYITSYIDSDLVKNTGDLDHFFPKSTYPILALSLYNFVPSCSICNSRFKKNRTKNILYPYSDGFEDNARFNVGFLENGSIDYLLTKAIGFKLSIEVHTDNRCIREKICNNIEVFRLNEIYQVHKEYVEEILNKKRIYQNGQLNEIKEILKGINLSDTEIMKFIFENYTEEGFFHDKPLSKLTNDILNDIK